MSNPEHYHEIIEPAKELLHDALHALANITSHINPNHPKADYTQLPSNEYHPAPHDIPDTQEGFDIDGNYHRLNSYSESSDMFIERPIASQLPQTSGGRWSDMGEYLSRTVDL